MRSDYAQRLMFNGILVFLIGLFMGFFIYFGFFPNGQIGLVAHLEGVLNGLFLAVVGLIWQRMSLSRLQERLTIWFALTAVWLNIFQAAWWAFLGRSRASPVFPADRAPTQVETIFMFNVILPILSTCFVLTCLMVLWGLHRGMAAQRAKGAAPAEIA